MTKNGTSSRSCQRGKCPRSRARKRSLKKGKKDGWTVHFATLMDNCHRKKSDMEPKFSKYKGRVALRADVVMDDSGSYAVFTERRSAVKRIVAPPQINTVWRPRTKWRHFEQESRSARRAGLASSTCASLKNAVEIYQAQFLEKLVSCAAGARSQRRGFAPTYFLFGTLVWSCPIVRCVRRGANPV